MNIYFQFLCDRDGKPVKRYAPSVQPLVSEYFFCDYLNGAQHLCGARMENVCMWHRRMCVARTCASQMRALVYVCKT